MCGKSEVSLDTVAFSPAAATTKNQPLEALVAAWSPIVDSVLVFLSTKVTSAEFGSQMAKDGFITDVSKHVGAMLYANEAPKKFSEFGKLVTGS